LNQGIPYIFWFESFLPSGFSFLSIWSESTLFKRKNYLNMTSLWKYDSNQNLVESYQTLSGNLLFELVFMAIDQSSSSFRFQNDIIWFESHILRFELITAFQVNFWPNLFLPCSLIHSCLPSFYHSSNQIAKALYSLSSLSLSTNF